ncbi:uncharacterized protein FOMMEDRAFT_59726, partial [Fomitiporia mediterranea MF3/22]|uniref:uncharacterized protein n=1 Tax=Fomitiporia mediterranea (strain MF3/22) TaxID=694068 RepID=UPI0004409728
PVQKPDHDKQQLIQNTSMEVKKDDLSYFSPLVTFQVVEDTIFKVPRREFEEESEVFEDMYSLPSENAKEGESDEHPLRLEGVSVSDFRCFLQALIRRPALRSTKSLTEHDLEMALKLAKMWCFNGLQEVLIKDLEALGLPASRKLQLARLYDIKEWYKPELRKLALRRSSLTLEEAERLGLDLTV